MKKLSVQGVVFLSLAVFAMPAWSLTIADVGSIDALIGQASIGSGDATELAWARSLIGDPTLTMTKYDVTAPDWANVDGYASSVFALELQGTPAYFFIKTGANTGNANDHFLFQNLADLNYAVISLTAMGFTGGNVTNIGKMSHIGEVPEPGTVGLLGIGLVGLVGYGRMRMKK